MDPSGLGANRDGGKTSEFERFGVIGPLGVEPSAGEPGELRDVAPPVAPEAELELEPEPELPPEPDDWAWADVIEKTTASAARSCLFGCFIEEERYAFQAVPRR